MNEYLVAAFIVVTVGLVFAVLLLCLKVECLKDDNSRLLEDLRDDRLALARCEDDLQREKRKRAALQKEVERVVDSLTGELTR